VPLSEVIDARAACAGEESAGDYLAGVRGNRLDVREGAAHTAAERLPGRTIPTCDVVRADRPSGREESGGDQIGAVEREGCDRAIHAAPQRLPCGSIPRSDARGAIASRQGELAARDELTVVDTQGQDRRIRAVTQRLPRGSAPCSDICGRR